MSFENEVLQLKNISWVGDSFSGGLLLPNGSLVNITDDSGYEATGELSKALQFILLSSQAQNNSLREMILTSRRQGLGLRLRAFHDGLQFLGRHHLIKNASAYPWLELLRHDHSWRDSFNNRPVLNLADFEIPSGKPWRETAKCILLIIAMLGLLGTRNLFIVPVDQTATFGLWAVQGLIIFSLARSLQALLQAILLRGLTGQAQTLRLVLTPISISLSAPSLGEIERRTVWEGCAVVASLLSLTLLTFLLPMAFLFLALVFTMALSPFVQSPLLQLLRYFYSLAPNENERSVAFWHTLLAFAWTALAGLVTFQMIHFLRAPLTNFVAEFGAHRAELAPEALNLGQYLGQWSGLAFFAWLLISVVASWLEDLASATIFGLESDRQAVREAFRLGSRRARSRPLRSAADIHKNKDWKNAALLKPLDEATQKELLKNASLITYQRGETLCHQGLRERELYILLSGEAGVFKRGLSGRQRLVSILSEGSAFGEVGYFVNEPRMADVRALHESVVLVLRPSPQNKILAGVRFSNLQMRIWFLQALQINSLFRNIPSESLDQFILQGHFIRKQPGDFFFKENDLADGCYFVVQGRGRIFQNGEEINQVGQGDILGEVSLLFTQAKRTASVAASTEMIALFLSTDAFWGIISSQLPLGLTIEGLAEARLRQDSLRLKTAQ